MFCNVDPGSVFTSPDVKSIYELPLELHRQGLDERLAELLNIWSRAPRLERWERIVEKVYRPSKGEVRIGIVGKYVDLKESYKSLNEALHARRHRQRRARWTSTYVDSPGGRDAGRRRRCSATSTPSSSRAASACAAPRGRSPPSATRARRRCPSSASASACRWRWSSSRATCSGSTGANSIEFDERTPHPVISLMERQVQVQDKGGTMRLGAYRCVLKSGSLACTALRQGRGAASATATATR